jgi:hypothetical protein
MGGSRLGIIRGNHQGDARSRRTSPRIKMRTGPSKTRPQSDVTHAREPHRIDRKAGTAREERDFVENQSGRIDGEMILRRSTRPV